jgi:putative ABC transport system ATP-binding protein
VEALQPCRLCVYRADYVAVVGASGSGKSTLLNVLGLLDRPTTGTYLLDGLQTAQLPDGDRTALRARRIGFVFQAFDLLASRTAEDNVALALVYQGVPKAQRRTSAREALDRVGLGHRTHALPTQMSGGERQRVAIARALAARPNLLLCDEPTGNLDSETALTVLDLVDNLHRDGQTIIMVTHDPVVAGRAGRTIRIHDGIVAEEQRGGEGGEDA